MPLNFQKLHVALPVLDLQISLDFYKSVLDARLVHIDKKRKSASIEYSRFEISLFQFPRVLWTREELGPFHFGHQVASKEEVDSMFTHCRHLGIEYINEPFDREDGDYAFFFKDPNGYIFEVYSGNHEAVRT